MGLYECLLNVCEESDTLCADISKDGAECDIEEKNK